MTNFIPIYPAEIIVYPNETIRIKLKESTYIQLVKDCFRDQKQFGIQTILSDKAMEYGTLAEIITITEHPESNTITVEVKGLQVFRILETINSIPDKRYHGAIVSYPENEQMKVHPNLSRLIFEEVKILFQKLNIENQLPSQMAEWNAYNIAHKFGLTKEQEFELLTIFNEVQRMEYLRRFFNNIMPEVDNVEVIKSRLNLN